MTIKNWFKVAMCAVLAFSFASCSDDDGNGNGGGSDVTPTEGISNEGYYKGDIFGANTGNLWVNFITDGMEWDDFEEDYVGPGYILCLDFNTTLAENPDFATLADGEYTAADNYAEFTFNAADGDSYLTQYTATGSTQKEVTGGTVKVSTANGYKVIDADLILDDGSDFKFSYVGKLNIINRTGGGQMSNLENNVTVNELTQGVALYFGETFTTTSDHYMVVLAGADYDLDENYGNAPTVWLGLNVTPGSNTGIPSGTYTLINAMDADDYDVSTALSGVYEESLGGFFGTWYFHTLGGVEAAMQTGTVKVTNNGNNNYKIEFNLKDGYGHSVTGTYSGTLALEDISE